MARASGLIDFGGSATGEREYSADSVMTIRMYPTANDYDKFLNLGLNNSQPSDHSWHNRVWSTICVV